MNTFNKSLLALAAASLLLSACDKLPNNGVNTGSGDPVINVPGQPLPSAEPTSPTTQPTAPAATPTPAPMFVQMERLGRPAINEGLLITNDLLNTWNMVPPTADLTPAAKPIADEATAVLKALGNNDAQVAALFKALLPDVMRIDTTKKSGYVGSAPGLLDNVTADLRPVGGRMIKDDVIDVTLLLAVPGGGPAATPIANLESDNVSYDGPNANGSKHKPVLDSFPYLAAPN